MALPYGAINSGLTAAEGITAASGVGLPVTLGLAGIQALLGGWQYLDAIKQARKNKRPFYSIDPSYQQNIDTLTNTLGLPQSALDLYYRNVGQNTNQGINAINASGGNANQIADLIGNRNASYENIAVQDALQRKQDIGGVLAAKLALAEQRDKAFQINQWAPYTDKAQAIASEKNSGLQNIFGSFNSAAGAFANQATSKLADSLSNITTPNSGVNVNKILQDYLTSSSTPWGGANLPPNPYVTQSPTLQPGVQIPSTSQPPSPFAPPPQNYPQYNIFNKQPDFGLDYNKWFNYMITPSQPYQQNQYIGY